MQVLVPLIATLVPLAITPGLLSSFDITPKIAVLLCGVALIALYQDANIHNVGVFVRTRPGRIFAGLLAAECISMSLATLFSPYQALSLNGGNWRRYGLISGTALLLFVLLAAAWLVSRQGNLRILLRAIAIGGTLAAIYGIAQYFGWDPLLPSRAYHVGEGAFQIVRPPGTLGHADYFGDWLVGVAFLAVALSELEEVSWLKVAARTVAALSFLAILLSGTRGALLGFGVGAMVWFLLKRSPSRIGIKEVSAVFACAACVMLLFLSPAGGKLRARLQWSIDDARGGARLLLWRDSLRMAAHRPIAGFGPETFATEFPRFESSDLARAYPDFYHESPHNIFLDALAGQGIVGLGTLLCLSAFGFWAGRIAWKAGRREAPSLLAALAGMLIAVQFASFIVATALYFHLLIALLVVATLPKQMDAPANTIRSKWLWAISVAASALMLGYSVRLVVSDRAVAVAQQHIARGDATGAAAAYRNVLRWQLPGSGSDITYSEAMQNLAANSPLFLTRATANREAIESGVRGVRSAEDRHNAWYHLATLFAARNDPAGVERSLRNAIAWSPNWYKPHWSLAQLLYLANQRAAALAEAQRALELNGSRDAEVVETWNKLHGKAP